MEIRIRVTRQQMNLRKLFLVPAFLSVSFLWQSVQANLVTNWLHTTSEEREDELKTMVEIVLESL